MIKDFKVSKMFTMLRNGCAVAEIARKLPMSEKTVRTYRDKDLLPSQVQRPPWTHRTRVDPLEAFWPEIQELLCADRRLKPVTLLGWLQQKHNVLGGESAVVGPLIRCDRDAGLLAYAQALRMPTPPEDPGSWIHLQRRDRWIEVTFGPRETEGSRNPFRVIRSFSPDGWTIKKYRYDRTAGWVTIAAAADAVQVSESTVRRRLEALAQDWGDELVTRTDGGHRRVYLPLFVNLWTE